MGAPFYGMGSSLEIDVGTVLFAGQPMSLDNLLDIPPFGSFTFPHPVRVAIDVRRVGQGLDITGSIEADVGAECARCLEDVVLPMTVAVEERLDPPSGTDDPFGENNVLNGTSLDVTDLVRQVLTSALPYGLTCKDDCRGLCMSCGRNKNEEGTCTCDSSTSEGDHGES